MIPSQNTVTQNTKKEKYSISKEQGHNQFEKQTILSKKD